MTQHCFSSTWFCRYSILIGLKPSNESKVWRKLSCKKEGEGQQADLIFCLWWTIELQKLSTQRSFNPCLIKQLYKESNQHNKFPLCSLSFLKNLPNRLLNSNFSRINFPDPSVSSFLNCANNCHWPTLALALLLNAKHNATHDWFSHAIRLKVHSVTQLIMFSWIWRKLYLYVNWD